MSFNPKLLGFLCQNSASLCADFAGMELKNYTPNFLPIRIPCLGSLDILYLLKAYFSGADGVLVLGCLPGHCRHIKGNERAKRRVQIFQSLLEILGVGRDRIDLAWIHPSEISKMVEKVNAFNEKITQLGPPILLQPDFPSWTSNLSPPLLKGDWGDYSGWIEFKKCDQCHQCREVCPVCFCKNAILNLFRILESVGWFMS